MPKSMKSIIMKLAQVTEDEIFEVPINAGAPLLFIKPEAEYKIEVISNQLATYKTWLGRNYRAKSNMYDGFYHLCVTPRSEVTEGEVVDPESYLPPGTRSSYVSRISGGQMNRYGKFGRSVFGRTKLTSWSLYTGWDVTHTAYKVGDLMDHSIGSRASPLGGSITDFTTPDPEHPGYRVFVVYDMRDGDVVEATESSQWGDMVEGVRRKEADSPDLLVPDGALLISGPTLISRLDLWFSAQFTSEYVASHTDLRGKHPSFDLVRYGVKENMYWELALGFNTVTFDQLAAHLERAQTRTGQSMQKDIDELRKKLNTRAISVFSRSTPYDFDKQLKDVKSEALKATGNVNGIDMTKLNRKIDEYSGRWVSAAISDLNDEVDEITFLGFDRSRALDIVAYASTSDPEIEAEIIYEAAHYNDEGEREVVLTTTDRDFLSSVWFGIRLDPARDADLSLEDKWPTSVQGMSYLDSVGFLRPNPDFEVMPKDIIDGEGKILTTYGKLVIQALLSDDEKLRQTLNYLILPNNLSFDPI